MNLIEAKKHLGKIVLYSDRHNHLENAPYLLMGVTVRINNDFEYVYIAELLDICGRSMIHGNLDKINPSQDLPDIRNALMQSPLLKNKGG